MTMLNRVTGLFGWIEANDRRSLQLFLAFLVYFQLMALVGLVIPLALLAPAYAPFYGWQGYLTVVVPGITIAAAAIFAVQMLWHVKIVRRRTDFRYVDASDEPRLCRIVEPLTIAAGIRTPYVGVIETPELNAFACGSRQKDAVIVVTRGLIDGLDDDQLASVIAHEVAHIRNGDTRLMAAANICVGTMQFLFKRRDTESWRIALGLLMTLVLPVLFVIVLTIGLINQLGFWLVYATRLGISSSREFIADAAAVQLTQNPAALVSALQTIDGRSRIDGMTSDQSAMMIDGEAEGEQASHPKIAERIAALVRLTGGMALIAPARRDTRSTPSAGTAPTRAFGRRIDVEADLRAAASDGGSSLFHRVRRVASDSPNSVFGFPRRLNFVLALWVALFLGFNFELLAQPSRLAAKFGLHKIDALMKLASPAAQCNLAQIGHVAGSSISMKACDSAITPGMIADNERDGMWHIGGGRFSSEAPEAVKIAQIAANHCFLNGASVSTDRTLALDETETNVSLAGYLGLIETQLANLEAASPGERDRALMAYVEARQTMLEVIFGYYGQPGADVAQAEFAKARHRAALTLVGERMRDPAFAAKLEPVQRAEYAAIAAAPDEYTSCMIKLGPDHLRPRVSNPQASVAREMRDTGLSFP